MNISLCTCGEDKPVHGDSLGQIYHPFMAAGTRHRCEARIWLDGGYVLCPRPAHHEDHDVECGIVTGIYLWVDSK